MTTSTINPVDAVVQFQDGTGAAWAGTSTPIPKGMVIIESDTGKIKQGDGVTLYADLPVIITIAQIISALPNDPKALLILLNKALGTVATAQDPKAAAVWRDPKTGALYFS